MRRIHFLPLALAGLWAAPLPARDAAGPDPWAPHRKLKVLYAGYPDGSREAAFETFLRKWFDTVDTIHLEKLSMTTARDFDVIIADWTSYYGKDGYPERAPALKTRLPDSFTRPVVAMTYVATRLRPKHKLDWL